MPKFLEEVFAGGAIKKYVAPDDDGWTETTEWDPQPFKDHNKVLRMNNTQVDTSGCAWHQAASIPTPVMEEWYIKLRSTGMPPEEVRRRLEDPKFLLQLCKDRDYSETLVSDKV